MTTKAVHVAVAVAAVICISTAAAFYRANPSEPPYLAEIIEEACQVEFVNQPAGQIEQCRQEISRRQRLLRKDPPLAERIDGVANEVERLIIARWDQIRRATARSGQ